MLGLVTLASRCREVVEQDMSAQFNAAEPQGVWQRRGCGPFRSWKPVEIVAVVLGFAIYWPIGVAILGWKFLQRRGYTVPDVFEVARDRFAGWTGDMNRAPRRPWRPFETTTGNAAFDEWRKAEMDKLDEQRRQLDAAERDFAEHKDNLRRARDREEFDRFMAARRGGAPA